MRIAALVVALFALMAWRPARAQCIAPSACICESAAPTIFQVQAIDGGLVDGGEVYAVVATFGQALDGGAPSQIVLQKGAPSAGLVGIANGSVVTEQIVPLGPNGETACGNGSTNLAEADAVHDMLDGDQCTVDVTPNFECDDHGGCGSTSGGFGLAAALFAAMAFVIARRRRS